MEKVTKNQLTWVWHCQHNVLLEPLTEPLEEIIDYIKKNKPKEEIDLRLKLLKEVKGELPLELIKAGKEYDKAWKKYDEAWEEHHEAEKKRNEAWDKRLEAWKKRDEAWRKLDEAWETYDYTLRKYLPQLKTLHQKECGCGYDFKRNTIFTKENGFLK
jgi:ArsR family metal-binding transcriptional regulator